MTVPVRIQSRDKDVWFDELPEKLSAAVDEYDLPNTEDWAPLAEISHSTLYEGTEVHGEAAVIEDDKLVAPATVYVKLQYDPNSDDPVTFNDAYPARVFFQSDRAKQEVVVNHIEIDTTSFFEN